MRCNAGKAAPADQTSANACFDSVLTWQPGGFGWRRNKKETIWGVASRNPKERRRRGKQASPRTSLFFLLRKVCKRHAAVGSPNKQNQNVRLSRHEHQRQCATEDARDAGDAEDAAAISKLWNVRRCRATTLCGATGGAVEIGATVSTRGSSGSSASSGTGGSSGAPQDRDATGVTVLEGQEPDKDNDGTPAAIIGADDSDVNLTEVATTGATTDAAADSTIKDTDTNATTRLTVEHAVADASVDSINKEEEASSGDVGAEENEAQKGASSGGESDGSKEGDSGDSRE